MDPHIQFLILAIFLHMFISILAERSSKQNVYKKVLDNNDECVCSNQNNLITVKQHLDLQDKNIERLIIILYRTENGTIYTYIPNYAKQSILPDLQYELDDDIIPIQDEQLTQIFFKNKSIKDTSPEYEPNNMNKENSLNHSIISLPSKPNCKDLKHNIINGNIPRACRGNKHLMSDKPNNITGKITYSLPHSLNPKQQYPTIEMLSQKVTGIKKPSINYLGSPLNTQDNNISTSSLVKQNQINNLNTFGVNFDFKYNHSDKQNPPSVQEGSFNNWFVNQMEILNESSNSIKKPFNFGSLQLLILEALKKQGVLISSNGILTDAHGKVFNTTNLYLRPLLIGEMIKYDSVKLNSNRSFALPEKSSYMDSILIAVLDPPKIITIIPVGRVKIPKSLDFRHVLYHGSKLSGKNNLAVEFQRLGKDLTQTIKYVHKTHKYSKTEKKSKNEIPPKQYSKIKNSTEYNEENILEAVHVNKSPDLLKYENDIPVISPIQRNILQQSDVLTKKEVLKKKKPSFNKDFKEEAEDGKDSDEDEDYLDFRIIGGAAATVSGFPISNRGRSGKISR